MTILRLKNPTNIYQIDVKKTRREREYLALEDLQIKSKFPRSNMPIREVGRSGKSKNLRGRRKKRKKPWPGRLGAGLKHHLNANNPGAKLGANDPGVEVAVMSPPRLRRRLSRPKTLAPNALAPRCVNSVSITSALRWGSRFWKHTSKSRFVKNFQKRTKKQKIRWVGWVGFKFERK